MRRPPLRFPHRPCDPRSRDVVRSLQSGRYYSLELSCGHFVKRRYLCPPTRAICEQCPSAGGMRLDRSA